MSHPRTGQVDCITIVSGGLDSVTLAHHIADQHQTQLILHFKYGQRHSRERLFAAECARRLNASYDEIDLTDAFDLIGMGSSLINSDLPIPHGSYAANSEGMKSTVVPGRNAIFASIAFSIAATHGASTVAMGIHMGEHELYPDCTIEFARAMQSAMWEALGGSDPKRLSIYVPFVLCTKATIVSLGETLNVPFDRTWSCYEGGLTHCGQCATCLERQEAFLAAGVPDPTTYLQGGTLGGD